MLVVGYYGFKNNGDDAMLLGILSLMSDKQLKIIHGEDLTINLKGVQSVKWTLFNLARETVKAQSVLIGGGTMLRDWGKGRFIQSLKILAYALFVKMLGKNLYFVNIGHDSRRRFYKIMHDLVFRLADYVSFRDNGFDSSVLIKDIPQRQPSKTLGIMLTPQWSIYYNNPDYDNNVVVGVAEGVKEWLNADPERKVKCISLNGHPKYSDEGISRKLFNCLGSRAEYVPYLSDPVATLKELSKCCATIGMRYHACVFSFLVGVPLIYIKTKPYCDEFYKQISSCPPVSIDISTSIKNRLNMLNSFKYKLTLEDARTKAREGFIF